MPDPITFNLGDFSIGDDDPEAPNSYTLAEKRLYFLTENPVPTELSDPEDSESELVVTMTDKQWFIAWCRAKIASAWAVEINRGQNRSNRIMKPDKVFVE